VASVTKHFLIFCFVSVLFSQLSYIIVVGIIKIVKKRHHFLIFMKDFTKFSSLSTPFFSYFFLSKNSHHSGFLGLWTCNYCFSNIESQKCVKNIWFSQWFSLFQKIFYHLKKSPLCWKIPSRILWDSPGLFFFQESKGAKT